MDYYKYLKSGLWKQRRYAALERVDFRCQLCGETDNLNVHHLSYEHLGNESPDELFVICGGHHWIEHFATKTSPPPSQARSKPILCFSVKRWLRKAQAIQSRGYLTEKSKQRLIELEEKYQDHIKRCSVCKIPINYRQESHGILLDQALPRDTTRS